MSHLKLVRVEIEGFRKFREPLVLDLRSPAGAPLDYLVLAGPNGCGKTTLLEVILLALGRDELLQVDADHRLRGTRVPAKSKASATSLLRASSRGWRSPLARRPPSSHEDLARHTAAR